MSIVLKDKLCINYIVYNKKYFIKKKKLYISSKN